MAKNEKRKIRDAKVRKILKHLEKYKALHGKAIIDAYRYNPASIRIRIIDPDFKGIDRMERDTPIWNLLDELPEDVVTDITMLVLVTPREMSKSGASLEFEKPAPSLVDFD